MFHSSKLGMTAPEFVVLTKVRPRKSHAELPAAHAHIALCFVLCATVLIVLWPRARLQENELLFFIIIMREQRHQTNYSEIFSCPYFLSFQRSPMARNQNRLLWDSKSSLVWISVPINREGKNKRILSDWRQFWAVSAASRNWDLIEFSVLLVPGMIRRRTPSAV